MGTDIGSVLSTLSDEQKRALQNALNAERPAPADMQEKDVERARAMARAVQAHEAAKIELAKVAFMGTPQEAHDAIGFYDATLDELDALANPDTIADVVTEGTAEPVPDEAKPAMFDAAEDGVD